MQDRYTGDIGDYVKLGILRALAGGHRLGIGWWLYPDEDHNGDGRHITYLQNPAVWRAYDLELFDHLGSVVASGERRVAALQSDALLPGALYFDEQIPTAGSHRDRHTGREAWFGRLQSALDTCDLIFLDPDNGFETKGFKLGKRKAGKSVALSEIASLRCEGRTIIVYHHQTRMIGGHLFELEHWGARLREIGFDAVDVLRASPYSARAFFLLNAPEDMRLRAAELAEHWSGKISWHPSVGLATAPATASDDALRRPEAASDPQ